MLANKLLVLIDGRTVYTPLFSGVFWEAQDVLLEDVDRIEVISGPGGTLWGANAVNGVINVITRPAADTQGSLAYVRRRQPRVGRGRAARRARSATTATTALYAKYVPSRQQRAAPAARASRDESDRAQVGFRADLGTPARRAARVQGDAYWGDIDQVAGRPRASAAATCWPGWTRELDDGGDAAACRPTTTTRTATTEPQFTERLDTIDVEAQYGRRVLERHQLLVGAGYRHARDRVGNTAAQAFLPAEQDAELEQRLRAGRDRARRRR